MKVELIYFKPNGKFYSNAEYKTYLFNLWEIWDEVKEMRDKKRLPGLIEGHSDYHIFILVPEHTFNCPHLLPIPTGERSF